MRKSFFASCRCGTRWNGLRTAHCGSCHHTFCSPSSFDKHRFDGRCRAPEESGLELKDHSGNYVWGEPWKAKDWDRSQ